jgi:hypothetical protein
MKILFIYGRPAVGKLTVAREVAKLTGGRLFHNHLTVNLVLSLHDFGTPGFVALRKRIWTDSFRSALEARIPLVVFTFNPEDSVPQAFIDELFAEVAASGAEMIPIELTAPERVIEERLGSESRRLDGKTLDPAAYRILRSRGVFDSPRIPAPRLVIDTERTEPAESARRIAALV